MQKVSSQFTIKMLAGDDSNLIKEIVSSFTLVNISVYFKYISNVHKCCTVIRAKDIFSRMRTVVGV